jgi:hypothetical protein
MGRCWADIKETPAEAIPTPAKAALSATNPLFAAFKVGKAEEVLFSHAALQEFAFWAYASRNGRFEP